MRTAGNIATILILVLMAPTVSVAGQATNAGTKPASAATKESQDWVDFTLPEPGGGQVSLAQFIGKKPVLLVFWATWCAICKEEVPVINRMHSEPPTNGNLQILALDFMESEKKVNAFISSKKVAYPVLLDRRGRVARKYKVVGIPMYILFDRDGKVLFRDHHLPDIGKYLK